MRVGSIVLLAAVFGAGVLVGVSQTTRPGVPAPSVVELREVGVENATPSPKAVPHIAPTAAPPPAAVASTPRPVERVSRRVEEDEIEEYERDDDHEGKNRGKGRSGESDD